MTSQPPQSLRLAGDPRTQAEFIALRNEIAKLSHPARPDVDWAKAEKLALTLFQQHGVDLQTASWYTLARAQRNGLTGMLEGLDLLAALLSNQWPSLWPQQTHARMTILSTLAGQLQQLLRSCRFQYSDLTTLYALEKHLTSVTTLLEKLELRHLSQLDGLTVQVANAARRLEQIQEEAPTSQDEVSNHYHLVPETTEMPTVTVAPAGEPLVWVMRETVPAPAPLPPTRWQRLRGFLAGVVTTLLIGGAGLWGWQVVNTPPPVSQTQQLAALAWQLGPDGQRAPLPENWQQAMEANALPLARLEEWKLAQQRLQALADQLNALDGKRGGYMTVSELKSAVFGIQQPLNAAMPIEELLRQYQAEPTPAHQAEVSQRLRQLLNRYLLTQQGE